MNSHTSLLCFALLDFLLQFYIFLINALSNNNLALMVGGSGPWKVDLLKFSWGC